MKETQARPCAPALLTGTSTEYLGRRPWPRVIRDRPAVFIVGPTGVGKTSVANRIAGSSVMYMDVRAWNTVVLDRIRRGRWAPRVLRARALVLDGMLWLQNRPGLVDMLVELLKIRSAKGKRTVVCQSEEDGSIQDVIAKMSTGSLVIIGLRFPKGKRGRIRFARRMCRELSLPEEAACGTEQLDSWCYAGVLRALHRWPSTSGFERVASGDQQPENGAL